MDMRYVVHEELSEEPGLPADIDLPEPRVNDVSTKKRLPRSSRERLKAAKSALADGYRPHRNPMKTVWGRVSDAERHLVSITKESREYKEARRLLREVQARKQMMDEIASAITRRLMIKQREMVADEFEFLYLARGYDAHISLSGPDKSQLSMECAPLNETCVLKIVHETDLLLSFERAGFKKIILGDGERFSWTHVF